MKIRSYAKQLFPVLDRLAYAIGVVATLSVSTAQAVPFEFSDVELLVRSELASPLTADQKTGFEPATSTNKIQSLIEVSGEPFGKHLDRGPFASATVSGAHAGGVGAAGFFFAPHVGLTAERFSRDIVTNVDTVAHPWNFIYDIEPIDVALEGGDGHHGEVAGIQVIANVEYFNSAGISLGTDLLVDYLLEVTKIADSGGAAAFRFSRSDELVADAGLGTSIAGFTGSVHYDGFEGTRSLRTLEPGDTATVEYDWLAFIDTAGFRETGAEAFIGDPFDLTGTGGGFSFVAAAVPEPSMLSLLLLGLGLVWTVTGLSRTRVIR